jgi:hypothetical protein
MVHAAVVQDGQSGVAILERLLVEVRGRLFARGIHIAQALLRPEDRDGPRAFRAAGFAYLTDLIYMSALASAECARPAIPLSLEWITYHDSTHATFIAALESSYIHSLDCPGLTGLRATEDVLAGHRATGEFDPPGMVCRDQRRRADRSAVDRAGFGRAGVGNRVRRGEPVGAWTRCGSPDDASGARTGPQAGSFARNFGIGRNQRTGAPVVRALGVTRRHIAGGCGLPRLRKRSRGVMR